MSVSTQVNRTVSNAGLQVRGGVAGAADGKRGDHNRECGEYPHQGLGEDCWGGCHVEWNGVFEIPLL